MQKSQGSGDEKRQFEIVVVVARTDDDDPQRRRRNNDDENDELTGKETGEYHHAGAIGYRGGASRDASRIAQVLEQCKISMDDYEPYGHYKAKISDKISKNMTEENKGHYVVVAGITPTPLGGREVDDDDWIGASVGPSIWISSLWACDATTIDGSDFWH